MLRPTTWAPAEGAGSASVSELSVSIQQSRARHREFVEAPPGDVDITTADFLLSVGRGIGDKENLPMFERLAAKMGATFSVSRPLVDAGWVPSSRQVGQSEDGEAEGLPGDADLRRGNQHFAGMKTSGTIIAVNTDPEAAIFNVAHYGAVADLLEVAEELEKLF